MSELNKITLKNTFQMAKGILAADERNGNYTKRLQTVKIQINTKKKTCFLKETLF
jgi:Fructose-bisphosphate aldolase class-I.